MIAIAAFVVAFAALAMTAGLLILARRASAARRDLSHRLHDMAMALDRRCDVLQHQLDAIARRQRVDHLLDLVSFSQRFGSLDAERARRLAGYVLELREEARQATGTG